MNTTELSDLMHGATDDLEPSQDFTRQVLHGGRRRRFRRRIALAASALAVVAVATSATVVAFHNSPVTVADPRLTAPTKGDLAGDRALLAEIVAVWRTDLPYAGDAAFGYFDDRIGEPHVYWAGNTPAGRAAIVLQAVNIHAGVQTPPGGPGQRTAEGLVAIDPKDGKLKLVGTRPFDEPAGQADYYLFGQDDRTLLIVDEGKPLFYYSGLTVENEATMTLRREIRDVRPTDGVAVVQIPESGYASETAAYQGIRPPDILDQNSPSEIRLRQPASKFLEYRLHDPNYRSSGSKLLPWDETWELGMPSGQTFNKRTVAWAFADDQRPAIPDYFVSDWTIAVNLPAGGRVIVVKETQRGSDQPRLTVIDGSDLGLAGFFVTDGGPVDRDAVLPVKYQVSKTEGSGNVSPANSGWIVAAKGKSLSYRLVGGDWQNAGRDAAFLPDAAFEVKVDDKVVKLR